ncbi:MAG: TVP38/TMEM64 family protein [Conexibacter sp.]
MSAPVPPGDAITARRRERRLALLRLGALAIVVGLLFAAVALTGDLSAQRVRDTVDDAGIAAPLAFMALSSLLTVAMFPGPLLAGASGLLFGTALGTPISIVAATLGASLAFSLSRRFGARAVDELSGHRVRVVQDFIAQRGFLSVLYARILPAMPYNVVNYAAGLTAVPLLTFAAATAIGCAPRAFAYTALGGSLSNLDSPAAIAAFGVLVAMGIGGLVLAAREADVRRRLRKRLSSSGDRERPPADGAR